MELEETSTLTGLAIGDALGMPFETHPRASEALRKWDGTFQPGSPYNTRQPERKAGEWTDDTKMAKALAMSLIEGGVYNPALASANYIDWYHSGDLRGMGKTTKEAMDRILKGHHWNSSGVLHAHGNAPAMRAAPLGVFYRHSLTTVADMARIDAAITHRSEEAIEGAVAVALGVAVMAKGLAEKNDILKPVSHLLRSEGPTISLVETRLSMLEELLPKGPQAATSFFDKYGTSAKTEESVPAAFLCFLMTSTFKDAVEMAVRAGGDTDTVAAITGALAGTYYGKEQVEPYLKDLEESTLLQHIDHLLWLEAPDIPEDV